MVGPDDEPRPGAQATRALPDDGRQPADEQAGRAQTDQGGRRISTLLVGLLAGVLIGATGLTAQGGDLRPDRTSDLAELVAQAAARNEELTRMAEELRAQNEQLVAAQGASTGSAPAGQQLESQVAGLTSVHGPAVRVTLTDAPVDYAPPGVNGDLLVVHEQDIQQVVNALWAGGAEAMTIQGQRVIATTAVKCVGNTVVLHQVPFAPPYVITAIGDVKRLEEALASNPGVQIYRQYAQVYQLGYQQQRLDDVLMPAYVGHLPQQASAG